jgi:hypothetical protein
MVDCLTLGTRRLRRAEHSIWTAVIDVDCSADDPTAHLACPRRDTGAPLRYLVTSWTSCYRPATARPPWPSCAAGEPDWLLSSFIHGIKRRPQDWLRPDTEDISCRGALIVGLHADMRQRIYLCCGAGDNAAPRGVTVNGQEISADKLIINTAMTIKVGPPLLSGRLQLKLRPRPVQGVPGRRSTARLPATAAHRIDNLFRSYGRRAHSRRSERARRPPASITEACISGFPCRCGCGQR